MESRVFLIMISACWVQKVMATCNTGAFVFSELRIYVGDTVNLASYITDLNGCTATSFELSVTPAGAVLDAATGAFSWTPPAGTTPTLTRALLDESSTFSASSTKNSFWSDPKLTSVKGFFNSNSEFTGFYTNTVQFSKDFRVHKYTLMKRGDGSN